MGIFLFNFFEKNAESETFLYLIFAVTIVSFLVLDLGLFNKTAKKISTKTAIYQSVFWILMSSLFGFLIYKQRGTDASIEYFSAYVTEYALSVDNIFVIFLILKYFKVRQQYFHKILFWGIFGAVVFRGIFIFVGALLIQNFHWILYVFGVFLIYSGIKIYVEESDEKIDPEKNPILKLCRRYLSITKDETDGNFFVVHAGKLMFTPLFLVVVLVETTDLIFAVDSIPAAFAITQNEFLIYTSNIFAVMGLRAMFFLLVGVITRFYLLQKGLSIILFFIGAKMLLDMVSYEISPLLSFAIIIVTIAFSIVFSVLFPRNKNTEER